MTTKQIAVLLVLLVAALVAILGAASVIALPVWLAFAGIAVLAAVMLVP